MHWLSEQVIFIPGQRQRQFASPLFKALTQQAVIEAYTVFSCLPIYQQGHNLLTEFSFHKSRGFFFNNKNSLERYLYRCE